MIQQIRIIPQCFLTAVGMRRTYGVIIGNKHFTLNSESELKSFLKGAGLIDDC